MVRPLKLEDLALVRRADGTTIRYAETEAERSNRWTDVELLAHTGIHRPPPASEKHAARIADELAGLMRGAAIMRGALLAFRPEEYTWGEPVE